MRQQIFSLREKIIVNVESKISSQTSPGKSSWDVARGKLAHLLHAHLPVPYAEMHVKYVL